MKTVVLSATSINAVRSVLEPLFVDRGEQVDWIDLTSIEFSACIGCGACSKTGRCVQRDPMSQIVADLHACDRLILSTPVFLGVHHPRMKKAVDRFLPLAGEQFTVRCDEMHHQSRLSHPFSLVGLGWVDDATQEAELHTFELLIKRHALNMDCPSHAVAMLRPGEAPETPLRNAIAATERAK